MGLCYSSLPLQVLIVGLDESGKSTLFQMLKSKNHSSSGMNSINPSNGFSQTDNASPYKPTLSFQQTTIRLGRRLINLKDLAGSPLTRDLWKHYVTPDISAVIFIVDAANRSRIEEARMELHKLMQLPTMPRDVPLLVLANKIDILGHKTYAELTEQLQLGGGGGLRSVHMHSNLKMISLVSGFGVREVYDWLGHLKSLPVSK